MSNDAARYTMSSKVLQQMLSGTFYYDSKNISPKERNGCATDVQHNNNLLLKHVGHIKTSVV